MHLNVPNAFLYNKCSLIDNHPKGGFPLGEIFRPNRNFLLSYKHSDGSKQKSFEFEQYKFRFDRKISPTVENRLNAFIKCGIWTPFSGRHS
jgi:hypothetical protein